VAVAIVRLGTSRHPDEGLRIGTVRRPPRGVPKADFAKRDFYDVWYPNLAPTVLAMKQARQAQQAQDERGWRAFVRKYRAEMAAADNARTLDLLAALSRGANFSLGCYCEDEAHCHRSVLRALLAERGAVIARR
jgi:uncharacterized protein YeaO (DUF488 family)